MSDERDDGKLSEINILNKLGIWTLGIVTVMFIGAVALMTAGSSKYETPEIPSLGKMQDQPLDWSDRMEDGVERLRIEQAAQNARINDLGFSIEYNGIILGIITAFFGALMTILVIFFGLKQGKDVSDQIQRADKLLDRSSGTLDDLEARDKKYFNDIEVSIEERLKELEVKVEEHHNKLFNDNRVDEESVTLTEEQIDNVAAAHAKPLHERSANDWVAIAFGHVDKKNYSDAAAAFMQEASRRKTTALRAVAEFNIGVAYGQAKEFNLSQKAYDALIEWGKDSDHPGVLEWVAKAMFNKALIYTLDIEGWKKDPKAAIAGYDALIEWGKNRHHPGVLEQMAWAMFNKAHTYILDIEGWKKDPEVAIAGYDALIKWGKDSDHPGVLEHVARAYANLSFILTDSFRDAPRCDEAIQVADDGLTLFKVGDQRWSENPAMLGNIGAMMNHKAQALELRAKGEDLDKAVIAATKAIDLLKSTENADESKRTFIAGKIEEAQAVLNRIEDRKPREPGWKNEGGGEAGKS